MPRRLTLLTIAATAVLFGLMFGDELGGVTERLDQAEPIIGVARIVDGDTVDVDGIRIRLTDIDACESGQPARVGGRVIDCGAWATNIVTQLAGGRELRCVPAGTDRYDRILAECHLPDGRSLNLEAVRLGAVFLYDPQRAPGSYRRTADEARASGAGIWAFEEVQHPVDYRRAQRHRDN